MNILNESEIAIVSGCGIVYKVAYFVGKSQAGWDAIDWNSVSQASIETQKLYANRLND